MTTTEPQVTISAIPTWNGHIDQQQLNAAAKAIGVKADVHVRVMRATEWKSNADAEREVGITTSIRPGLYGIALNETVAAEQLNHALLHELTHVRQRQEDERAAVEVYSLANIFIGYRRNPFEVEANEEADRLASQFQPIEVTA